MFGRDICNWMYNISKQQLRIRADEWPKERGVGDRSQGTMVILITSSQVILITSFLFGHLCRLFLGPGSWLVARWNRLGEAVKTRERRGKTGKKWPRYGLRSVNKEGTGGITWNSMTSRSPEPSESTLRSTDGRAPSSRALQTAAGM